MDFYYKAILHTITGNTNKKSLTVSMDTPALLFIVLTSASIHLSRLFSVITAFHNETTCGFKDKI